ARDGGGPSQRRADAHLVCPGQRRELPGVEGRCDSFDPARGEEVRIDVGSQRPQIEADTVDAGRGDLLADRSQALQFHRVPLVRFSHFVVTVDHGRDLCPQRLELFKYWSSQGRLASRASPHTPRIQLSFARLGTTTTGTGEFWRIRIAWLPSDTRFSAPSPEEPSII